MIVYPAIDLRGGKVVRLRHGDPTQETRFADDPLEVAQRWVTEGAAWLHVVNLDGALGGEGGSNLDIVSQIAAAVGVPVQFGGGMRSLDDAQQALDAGVARVVLGTAVVDDPAFAATVLDSLGAERVAFALDARGGKVARAGWQATSDWTPVALGQELAALGALHALYTDISRDGDLSGVNVAATAALARETGLRVIASGGVASLADVVALRERAEIAGVVIGRALYVGAVSLPEAIEIAGK